MQFRPDQTKQPLVASYSQFKGRTALQFSLSTLDHSCNIFGKFWSPVLALLWTQTMSKLALRALSDLESPRTDWSRNGQPSAYQHTNKWRSKIYLKQHWTPEVCHTMLLSVSKRLPRTAAPPLSSRRDIPELSFLPGVPTTPCIFGSKYSNNCLPFKTQLSHCQSELELAHYSERGARIN